MLNVAITTARHWSQSGFSLTTILGGNRRFKNVKILSLMSPSQVDVNNKVSVLVVEDDKNERTC
jgi:hypothetical protein